MLRAVLHLPEPAELPLRCEAVQLHKWFGIHDVTAGIHQHDIQLPQRIFLSLL